MKNKSLEIILSLYKKENISEEEAIHLITNLFSSNLYYYPWWITPSYNTTDIKYDNPQIQKFEITCKDG